MTKHLHLEVSEETSKKVHEILRRRSTSLMQVSEEIVRAWIEENDDEEAEEGRATTWIEENDDEEEEEGTAATAQQR